MTFPAYITDGALPPQSVPSYEKLRLISVVGGGRQEQLRTLKLAALHQVSDTLSVRQMRIYTDNADTWRFSGFTNLAPLSSLAHGIGELPDVTIVDHLDTATDEVIETIEHLKASVRPNQLLVVSYTENHPVAHNADLVHWLGVNRDAKTG